jgi:hypothetical protein
MVSCSKYYDNMDELEKDVAKNEEKIKERAKKDKK